MCGMLRATLRWAGAHARAAQGVFHQLGHQPMLCLEALVSRVFVVSREAADAQRTR